MHVNLAVIGGRGDGGHRHGHGAEEVGIGPVRREEAIMLQHGAGSERTARRVHSGWQAGRVSAHRRKICSGAAWPASVLGQGRECGRITQDRKMQGEG